MVASPGASMPAPLAMPPTMKPAPTATACLGTVSVVMIARAASSPPADGEQRHGGVDAGQQRGPSAAARRSGRSSRPRRRRRRRPAPSPTYSAVAWVSWKPAGPVQALAPPELSTTASTRPSRTTCWVQTTGAALTRLAVKTPAAAVPARR